MRHFGYSDAVCTPPGRDGGIDVVAGGAVAQVKDYGTPIGRPVLQRFQGAALGRPTLFFARQGYTADARRWADEVGMALFRFDLQGTPEPVNRSAALIAKGTQSPRAASTPAQTPASVWTIPTHISRDRATSTIEGACEGRFSRRELVLDVRHVWAEDFRVRLDITRPKGKRGTLYSEQYEIRLDGMTGQPPLGWRSSPSPQLAPARPTFPSAYSSAALVRSIVEDIDRLGRLTQQAARVAAAARLAALGVPHLGVHSLRASEAGSILHPIFIGRLQGPNGRRIVAIDGVTGVMNHGQSQVFTANGAAVDWHLTHQKFVG